MLVVDDEYKEFVEFYKAKYTNKGKNSSYGKWCIFMFGRNHNLHRVLAEIVLNMTIPTHIQVDHIDRDTNNNSLSNLRLSTSKLNSNNRGTMPAYEEYKYHNRLAYGNDVYGNKIRTPKAKAKSKEDIQKISRFFHSLCQGNDFSQSTSEDWLEFRKLFKTPTHLEKWFNTYGERIVLNRERMQTEKVLVQEFSGFPYGTTLAEIKRYS